MWILYHQYVGKIAHGLFGGFFLFFFWGGGGFNIKHHFICNWSFFLFIYLFIINSKWQHSVNISIYKYIIVRKKFRMEEKKTEQIEGEK